MIYWTQFQQYKTNYDMKMSFMFIIHFHMEHSSLFVSCPVILMERERMMQERLPNWSRWCATSQSGWFFVFRSVVYARSIGTIMLAQVLMIMFRSGKKLEGKDKGPRALQATRQHPSQFDPSHAFILVWPVLPAPPALARRYYYYSLSLSPFFKGRPMFYDVSTVSNND